MKPTHQIQTDEIRKPVSLRVKIPDPSYHCKRCDKDVIGGRCECLVGPSPWEITPRIPDGVWTEDHHEKEPRNIWKWIAIVLLLILMAMTFVLSYKINQLNEVIDFQQQLFEELERDEITAEPEPQSLPTNPWDGYIHHTF